MRVLIINEVCGNGSTGKIVCKIADNYRNSGNECMIAYGRLSNIPEEHKKYSIRIGNDWNVKVHALKARCFDECGFGSAHATRIFVQWAEQYNPDLIWLHNLHGYYINIEILFSWIKTRQESEIKWTLHDCWPFTGHCAHFVNVACEQWKHQCINCPQIHAYPKSWLVDNSRRNFIKKKELFSNIVKKDGTPAMTIITPSKWLADLTRQSFLGDYPILIQHTTIDLEVFKPVKSYFREKYNLGDKFIVLGVANVWNAQKGLNDFVELSERLDKRFLIVLVGLTKCQIKHLPSKILGIERTTDVSQLVQIYSASNLLFNPTYEDTFPTVNLEAESCGLPVITYDVGGTAETIQNPKSLAVRVGDLALVEHYILRTAAEEN